MATFQNHFKIGEEVIFKETLEIMKHADHLHSGYIHSPFLQKITPYFVSSEDFPISCNNDLSSAVDVHFSLKFKEIFCASIIHIYKISLGGKDARPLKLRRKPEKKKKRKETLLHNIASSKVFFPYLQFIKDSCRFCSF